MQQELLASGPTGALNGSMGVGPRITFHCPLPTRNCSPLSFPPTYGGRIGPDRMSSSYPTMKQWSVNILDARSSKDPGIMHLLCSLLLASEHFNFIFSSSHVPGLQNKIADALSYFNQQAFRRLAPHTHQHPVHIPADLLEALSNPH